ncbi:hypothetical protein L211DRAFT_852404 [Terfezia boudieri ATCC MYA-4762]|uniref:Uncharacterized protein n=1 Tax=Terfezia boudieri ATCC MYA-4762 TaxID=1051890 RepID=A0A3N4LIA4_9PEZI|nr:hypothetical protein L211DRAFT_852404 [Terfezia boudieri ATCC MYA-4762]
MPQHRKGKGRSAKPLAVPTLDNRPRYKTPDPVQPPTPGPTPSAILPTIFKKRLGGTLTESKEPTLAMAGLDIKEWETDGKEGEPLVVEGTGERTEKETGEEGQRECIDINQRTVEESELGEEKEKEVEESVG